MNTHNVVTQISWFAHHEAEKPIEEKFENGTLSLKEYYYLVVGSFLYYRNNGPKPRWYEFRLTYRVYKVRKQFLFLINALNNKR